MKSFTYGIFFGCLFIFNAYAAFDFANYTPTLDAVQNTTSGYILSFIPVDETSGYKSFYVFNNDETFSVYTYSLNDNPARNVALDRTIIDSNLDGTKPLNLSSISGYFLNTSGGIINDDGQVGSITADFVKNVGSAIYNTNANIDSILGDFVGNLGQNTGYSPLACGAGAAIFNYESYIGSINSNFIGNIATNDKSGGAIYNYTDSTFSSGNVNFNNNGAKNGLINSITGTFIYNESANNGGAIYNKNGLVKTINADFIGNTAYNGGAIYNQGGYINSITGDFNGNIASGYGGAIYTDSAINIYGNFIGNSVIATDDINLALGGAIYTNTDWTVLAGTTFTGNHTQDKRGLIYNAIYIDNMAKLTLRAESDNPIVLNDNIDGNRYSVDIYGKVLLNNAIVNAENINITETSVLVLNKYYHNIDNSVSYGGIATTDFFGNTLLAPNLNLSGWLDIANGYTEILTFNNLTALYDGAIYLDIDPNSMKSDMIVVNNNSTGKRDVAFNLVSDSNIRNKEFVFAKTDSNISFNVVVNASNGTQNLIPPFLYDINYNNDSGEWTVQMNHFYNTSYHKPITWDFIENYTVSSDENLLALGGAIYTDADISFSAKDKPITFSGNYTLDSRGKINNAIFVNTKSSNDINIVFETIKGNPIVVNDEIEGAIDNGTSVDYTNGYNITVQNVAQAGVTPPEYIQDMGKVEFNNSIINVNDVNVIRSIFAFNQNTEYQNNDDSTIRGNFINPSAADYPNIYLNYGVFDIANGYMDTIFLNELSSKGGNNYVIIDIDPLTLTSDQLFLNRNSDLYISINALNDIDIKDQSIVFATLPNYSGRFILNDITCNGLECSNLQAALIFDDTTNQWKIYNPNYQEPDTPTEPVEPDTPTEPDVPTEPTDPEIPTEPDTPTDPVDPDIPTEPDVPTDPTDPVDPENPITNEKLHVYPEVVAYVGLTNTILDQTRNAFDTVIHQHGTGIWVQPVFNNITNTEIVDAESRITGLEFGYNKQLNNQWLTGIHASVLTGKHKLNGQGQEIYSDNQAEINMDSVLFGGYLKYNPGKFNLFLSVYGGNIDADIDTDDGLTINTKAQQLSIKASTGYNFNIADLFGIKPQISLTHTRLIIDDIIDPVGKTVSFDALAYTQADMAINFNKQFNIFNLYIEPAYIMRRSAENNINMVGIDELKNLSRTDLMRLSTGLTINIASDFMLHADFNYITGENYTNMGVKAGIKCKF